MFYKNQHCLVTGGASFIGSHLVEALVAQGAKVRVADDLSSGKAEHLEGVEDQIEFLEGDLKQIDFAIQAVQGCDVVFHLAADHGGRGYIASHPASCASNMALDNIVFESAAKQGVKHIIFTSSACVYPTDIQLGKELLQEGMVDFDTRGGAFADEEYGWAKLMGELSLRAYHKQYGIKAAIARLSTVYGPRENESHALVALIAKAFIQQSPFEIWGTGEQSRGFTYVDDIVDGILRAGEHIHDASAVNVGTSDFISLNEVAEAIFEAIGWSPPLGLLHQIDKPVGVMHRALCGKMARQRCGWKPQTKLQDGIKNTVDWYVNSRDPSEVEATLEHLLMQR